MGYTTKFDGELKFIKPLTTVELAYLNQYLTSKDPDDFPDAILPEGELRYIQFELTKDFSGIKWDGSEKFYEAENAVNFLLLNMQKEYPDFGFTGQLYAQGEEVADRWLLVIENGVAVRKEVKIEGDIYECPNCGEHVVTSEARKIQ